MYVVLHTCRSVPCFSNVVEGGGKGPITSLNKYSLAVVREVNARGGEVGGRGRGRVESCSSGR